MNNPRKAGGLERWYKAVIGLAKKLLRHRVVYEWDEIHEVIPITNHFGLWHRHRSGIVEWDIFMPQNLKKFRKIGH